MTLPRKAKPLRMWAIKEPGSSLCYDTAMTRSAAIGWIAWRDDDGHGYDREAWAELRKQGYRAVRVTVREEE